MATTPRPGNAGFQNERPTRRTTKSFARRIRDLHLYLGTFFAPAILFFAFTGALQTFGLHESHPGDTYKPPVWIRTLAQIHKDQTSKLPPPRPEPPRKATQQGQAGVPGPRKPANMDVSRKLMQWFVFGMSVGLIGTTLLGIYMAYAFSPRKSITSLLLISGFLIPVLMLII